MSKRRWVMAGVLFLLTFSVYARAIGHDFINYDDPLYVTDNAWVRRGLSLPGLGWALRTFHTGNWHPLTWLSHQLDASLFGLRPAGHHLVSLLLHASSAAALFLVLEAMTGFAWRSFVVAALFAVHPLRVESVAWVAERKDVLAGLGWMLAMGAHVFHARRPGWRRYLPVFVFMALGLAAKPMLVTLPFVLLLLDFWPLGRWRPGSRLAALTEKFPLLLLSLASGLVTYAAQKSGGAVNIMESFHLPVRLSNALLAYVRYILKTAWPAGLSIFYRPLGMSVPAAWTWGAAAMLAAATALAVITLGRRPFLAVGWFWYLGALVPVIGLVQVGGQSMADRYTYLPQIGLLLAAVWLLAGAAEKPGRLPSRLAPAISFTVIAALSAAAWVQAGYWRDSLTLFQHAIRIDAGNFVAYNNAGTYYASIHDDAEAAGYFREALRLNPSYQSHYNLAGVLARLGRTDEAIANFRRAIDLKPGFAPAHGNLALALAAAGRYEEAAGQLELARALDPRAPIVHYNLGMVAAARGRLGEAEAAYRRALELDPAWPEAVNNLGIVLARQGRMREAAAAFTEALRLNPGDEFARRNLRQALNQGGTGR